MRYILIILLFIGCLFMGSCAFLDYVRKEAGKYSDEIDKLAGKKTALEGLAKEIIGKLKSKDLTAREVIVLTAKLALTTQEIVKISSDIADKREDERKEGVPLWYSLLNLGISALGGGGLGTLLVRLIPGRHLKFKESD